MFFILNFYFNLNQFNKRQRYEKLYSYLCFFTNFIHILFKSVGIRVLMVGFVLFRPLQLPDCRVNCREKSIGIEMVMNVRNVQFVRKGHHLVVKLHPADDEALLAVGTLRQRLIY